MNSLPKISEAELEVMKVLWDTASPLTANEVIQALEKTNDWSPKTVRTLLNRLVRKKPFLLIKKKENVYIHSFNFSR